MSQIRSQLLTGSAEFRANAAAMRAQVEDLRRLSERTALGGSKAARTKHTARGKLLVRERIDALLDAGAPFMELSALAANGMYGDDVPGAGLVTGIGRISGRECVIVANDATVKGGTYYPITVKKHLRAQEVAWKSPALCLSGGLGRRLSAAAG